MDTLVNDTVSLGQNVTQILLNGVPLAVFIAFYIAGIIGVFISYAINVAFAVKNDPTTSNKFKRSEFKVKVLRVVLALLLLAVGIIFPEQIWGFVFHSDAPIQLNLWSAFMTGMGTDRIGKGFAGLKK